MDGGPASLLLVGHLFVMPKNVPDVRANRPQEPEQEQAGQYL
jgi:hypothetical protein